MNGAAAHLPEHYSTGLMPRASSWAASRSARDWAASFSRSTASFSRSTASFSRSTASLSLFLFPLANQTRRRCRNGFQSGPIDLEHVTAQFKRMASVGRSRFAQGDFFEDTPRLIQPRRMFRSGSY